MGVKAGVPALNHRPSFPDEDIWPASGFQIRSWRVCIKVTPARIHRLASQVFVWRGRPNSNRRIPTWTLITDDSKLLLPVLPSALAAHYQCRTNQPAERCAQGWRIVRRSEER